MRRRSHERRICLGVAGASFVSSLLSHRASQLLLRGDARMAKLRAADATAIRGTAAGRQVLLHMVGLHRTPNSVSSAPTQAPSSSGAVPAPVFSLANRSRAEVAAPRRSRLRSIKWIHLSRQIPVARQWNTARGRVGTLMRHHFLVCPFPAPEAISFLTPGMAVPASPRLLIAPPRGTHRLAPCETAAASAAVPLTAVTDRADANPAPAPGAQEQSDIAHRSANAGCGCGSTSTASADDAPRELALAGEAAPRRQLPARDPVAPGDFADALPGPQTLAHHSRLLLGTPAPARPTRRCAVRPLDAPALPIGGGPSCGILHRLTLLVKRGHPTRSTHR